MNERIMILGGGNCQLNAVKTATKRGFEVILVDYLPEPPAAKFAAVHIRESSFDIDACLHVAQEYAVKGVLCVGTDQPVYTAACVSEKTGLPSAISRDTAFAVTNKKRMKTLMSAAAIPTAEYIFADLDTTTEQITVLKAPYVVKPLDSQGQRGVVKVQDAEAAVRQIPLSLSFSRCSEVLIESFYPGDEITYSGWVSNGRLTTLIITDRLHYPSPEHIGICIGHRCPSVHKPDFHEIEAISRKLCEIMEIQNGPVYIQMLIGDEGVKVNEIACRIGGAFEDFVIPFVSGFDILKATIDLSTGKSVFPPTPEQDFTESKHCAAVQLLFCRNGKIGTITPLEKLLDQSCILDAGYNYKEGDLLPEVENATARFGHAVIFSPDGKPIKKYLDEFYKRLHVTDEMGREMLVRYYPES